MRNRKARRISEAEFKKIKLLLNKKLTAKDVFEITGWSESAVKLVKKFTTYDEYISRNEKKNNEDKIENNWGVIITTDMKLEKAQKLIDFLSECQIEAKLTIKGE